MNIFKKYLIILLGVLFISCYNTENLNPCPERSKTEYVYLYDVELSEYSVGQVIGNVKCYKDTEYHIINRQCDIIKGYIKLGTTNILYPDVIYDGYISISINDNDSTIVKSYTQFKLIINNEI